MSTEKFTTTASSASNSIDMATEFANVSKQAKEERKAGTLKLSDLKKVMKEMKAEITLVEGELIIILKKYEDDEMKTLEAEQYAERKLKAIEIKYKDEKEEYNNYNVETAEALSGVLVQKFTKPIAPITRGIASGFRQAKSSLFGINK